MATTPQDTPPLSPELVVVAHPDARLRMNGTRVRSSADGAAELEKALAETGAELKALFGPDEEHILAARRASAWDLPDLSVYYHAAVAGDHHAVAARLTEVPAVAGAFVKPPPAIDTTTPGLASAATAATATANVTADLTGHQGYLLDTPGGVGANSVRAQPGGTGSGVQVINVGGAWRLTHEDLAGVGGVVGGQPIDAVSFRNHGTAVLGVVRATQNAFGMTGIAPGCAVRQVATFGLGTAAAIRLAADSFQQAGGVILIEWQRPGPAATGAGSAGFLPLEWWPDDFAAIAYATAKGMIVIEPAGNGSVSLDDPLYNTPAPGFPVTWRNPFNRANADCGAILVGAGAPPPAANSTGPDRSRLPFSNTGASIDAQGWGAGLATLGYGDLQGGDSEDAWYTASFGGTSGAAAMVAGVVAALQGLQLARAKNPPLTPGDVRGLLRQTGAPQQDGPDGPATDHPIGSRPDLVAMVGHLAPGKDESKDNKGEPKESKDESKDNKDENKDTKDGTHKDLHDKAPIDDRVRPGIPLDPGTPAALAEPRRSAEQVRHFIAAELRPTLSASALLYEPDIRGRDAAELAAELRPQHAAPVV